MANRRSPAAPSPPTNPKLIISLYFRAAVDLHLKRQSAKLRLADNVETAYYARRYSVWHVRLREVRHRSGSLDTVESARIPIGNQRLMQLRFLPVPQSPIEDPFAAGAETDANVFPLIWNDVGTALTDGAFETPPPSLSNQDTALTASQNNLDDDIAAPPNESAADSASHHVQDATGPEDGGGRVPTAIPLAAVTSIPALAVLANPVAGSAGSHIADVGIDIGSCVRIAGAY